MASKRYTVKQVSEAIIKSKSWREVCRYVGLKDAGGNSKTLKQIANKYGFDYSHFLGQGCNIGYTPLNEIPIEEVFIRNSKYTNRGSLKSKILKYKLLDYKCSECGLDDIWNSKFLVLHIDHINGDSTDNRIENLRFLCPNCHSQTDTYCVNSEGKIRKFCKKCTRPLNQMSKTYLCQKCISEDKKENLKKIKSKKIKSSKNSKNNKCRFKDRSHKRKFHVTKDELVRLIEEKSFCEIVRKFGVSDNAIRRRAKRLGII